MQSETRLKQNQIILINDLSGFGRCSMSVQLPVLSAMGNECLMMPTALLSNHTGYDDFYIRSLEEDLDPWLAQWKHLPIHPKAILTGFLGGSRQARSAKRCIEYFRDQDGCLCIVDPVLGDNGSLYASLSEHDVEAMKQLARMADVITPNITEACLLAEIPFSDSWNENSLGALCVSLQKASLPERIVITGISMEDGSLADGVLEQDTFVLLPIKERLPGRSGTGDVFSAVLCGMLAQDHSLVSAAKKAAWFTRKSLLASHRLGTPKEEGCAFEMVLGCLCLPCSEID